MRCGWGEGKVRAFFFFRTVGHPRLFWGYLLERLDDEEFSESKMENWLLARVFSIFSIIFTFSAAVFFFGFQLTIS